MENLVLGASTLTRVCFLFPGVQSICPFYDAVCFLADLFGAWGDRYLYAFLSGHFMPSLSSKFWSLYFQASLRTSDPQVWFPNSGFKYAACIQCCLWLCFSTHGIFLSFCCCLLSGTHQNRSVTAASEIQQPQLGAKSWRMCVSYLSSTLSFIAGGSFQHFCFSPVFIWINKMSGPKM